MTDVPNRARQSGTARGLERPLNELTDAATRARDTIRAAGMTAHDGDTFRRTVAEAMHAFDATLAHVKDDLLDESEHTATLIDQEQ